MELSERMSRRAFVKTAAIGAAAGSMAAVGFPGIIKAQPKGPIKMGILMELTGLEGIFGTMIFQCAQLAVGEINAAGGLLGRQIKILVEDNETDPKVGIEKAKRLTRRDKVDVVVGTITSAMRNAVTPVISATKTILMYSVEYEGGHCDKYLVVTGPSPNQQIAPFVPWILKNLGKRFYLVGSDYVWPRESFKVVKKHIADGGGVVLGEEYFPFHTVDYSATLNRIKAAKPSVVYQLFAGSDIITFGKQFFNFGLHKDITVCSNGLEDVTAAGLGEAGVGNISSQPYHMSMDTPKNKEFVAKLREAYSPQFIVNHMGEAMYAAVHLWARAVKKAGSVESAKVLAAIRGESFEAPSGTMTVDPRNQHAVLNSQLARVVDAKGTFEIFERFGSIPPEPGCSIKA